MDTTPVYFCMMAMNLNLSAVYRDSFSTIFTLFAIDAFPQLLDDDLLGHNLYQNVDCLRHK